MNNRNFRNRGVLGHLIPLLEAVVEDQHPEFGGGAFSVAAYDTAWVAMVRDPKDPSSLAFPLSFEWLLRHQRVDGSWGGPFPHTLLPTLAGLLALLKAPRQKQLTIDAAFQAEAYLRTALPRWSVDEHESVGFEVVAPALLGEIEKLGKFFTFPHREQLMSLHKEKLLIGGPDLIYAGRSNLIHSLEALGESIDFARLKRQQATNGAYGCSPAATAAVLIHGPTWDARSAQWLEHLTRRAFDGEQGAMPNAYPIDVFEGAWVLYNLAHAGLTHDVPAHLRTKITTWLQDSLTPEGASITRFPGIPFDADDTGMVIAALNLAGVPTSAESLRHFERSTHFACFELERGASLSANAHVLAALLSLPVSEQVTWAGSISKVVDFLYDQRRADGSWKDKWHMTPYYGTVCSVLALAEHPDVKVREKLLPTVTWILETQSSRDGGWGVEASTLEDTSYAVQGLLAAAPVVPPESGDRVAAAIAQGRRFLGERLEQCMSTQGIELPGLWLGKELYTPPRVVISAILASIGSDRG